MTTTPTQMLSDAGVSIWLDDLSRGRLANGTLRKLIEEKNVVGVTTNPSIFHSAITTGHDYDAIIAAQAAAGATVEETVFEITTTDVADACELFAPVAAATKGVDGRVSIEVDPRLAWDTAGTIAEAKHLYKKVGKDNVHIKIPATLEGLEAITATLAEGISVNVTLIFSLERYRAVINAFQTGLEQAKDNGHDLSKIHSVASFFVSRVDSEVDKRLDAIGTDAARNLKGTAAIANARLAYAAFKQLKTAVEELDAARGTGGNFAFYLSVPPKFFPKVAEQLKKHGLAMAPEGSWRRTRWVPPSRRAPSAAGGGSG